MIIVIEEQARSYIARKLDQPAISISLEERPRGV
ncbi:hypothetical protein SPSIL_035380 [Sporomusa silvacetica DSM 10669]|uniref:Uncharacterized protein n=1 Tax=Sporomusa silvacetica DSM 10669 TaxID=1123289 RepID=A0ABZ3INV1_9FIRM|nr:hypothetical protein SPSIL_39940 [Sporomusa silvacetica DSM 10669]